MLSRKTGKYSCNLLVMSFLISAFLIQATVPTSSQAQSAITSDGTMGTAVTYDTGSYTISAGTIRGTNQFHSFGMFNVPTAESATLTGPPTIENIIGRVTGGELSNIDGLISSTVDGANLFLLNPAGIFFGPNARLDVKGSFHASTADYLKLGDGGIFYADPAGATVLAVASPTAFGFLDVNPAGISIQESALEVPADKTLSIVGGEVDIVGATGVTSLLAPGGRINIASVASAGEVIPNVSGDAADLNVESFGSLGSIELTGAAVNAGGPGGGTVVIRGGQFMLNGSTVFASVTATGGGAVGEGIDIQVADKVVLDNTSQLGTNVFGGAADNSGGVRILASDVEIKNFSEVQSVAFAGSAANSGDIEITANNSVLLDNVSYLRTGTGGSGNSGNIVLQTGDLVVQDAGRLYSPAFDGSGNGGNINVIADSILFSNERYLGGWTGISARTGVFDYTTFVGKGTGSGGDVTVNANSLQMLASTEISTPSFFSGQGGDITLNINGDVSIQGNESLQPYQTGIFANTFVYGQGGSLSLTADSLDMTNKTAIQTATFGFGNAGNTLINVGSLEVKDRSFISTSGLFGAGGSSGNLEINADTILISGPENSADPFGADFTGLSALAGPWGGQGGDMTITATDTVTLTSRAGISASSVGPDAGGNLNINTGTLQVMNGSNLTSSAFGSGDGGTVDIQADTVRVSGVHPEPFVDESGATTLAVSGIASQAGVNGGSAGDVTIRADRVEVVDGGKLGVDVFGPGNGGNLEIVADSVLVSDVNAVLRDFLIASGANPKWASSLIASGTDASRLGDDATGNGGRIRIAASDLRVQDGALISSETTTPGTGGNIELEADNVTFTGGASISAVSRFSAIAGKAGDISITASQSFSSDNSSVTTAAEQATGGDITITSRETQLANGSLISAESSGPGNAGNITINAADVFLMSDSSVTTEAKEAAGGNITIHTDYMVRLGDSLISASVRGGPDTVGGDITIDPEYVILRNSQIIAKAFEGRGGNIRIVAGIFLADQDSTVDASSEKGIDGTVEIRAPIKDVSRKVKPLPEKFTGAAVLLRESCIARMRGGAYSSFIVGGREGLPLEPGSLLPSPLLLQ